MVVCAEKTEAGPGGVLPEVEVEMPDVEVVGASQ